MATALRSAAVLAASAVLLAPQAADAQALVPGVAVLPLQVEQREDAPLAAVAARYVEAVLELRPDIAVRGPESLDRLFADASGFEAWLATPRLGLPEGLARLGLRHVVGGLLAHSGAITLTLKDVANGRETTVSTRLDAPGFSSLRRGVLTLLGSAGLAPAAALAPKALWHEELPADAARLQIGRASCRERV